MIRQHDPDVNFLGVTVHSDHDEIRKIVDIYGLDFPHIVDGGEVFADYGVTSHPTTIFRSADGTETRVTASQGPDSILAAVEALLPAN
ncbi:MAG: hypothetical protein GY929_13220 [Actinomycetia bacterium]|nr:hypothetical protein [Actinomycetes bacterium]